MFLPEQVPQGRKKLCPGTGEALIDEYYNVFGLTVRLEDFSVGDDTVACCLGLKPHDDQSWFTWLGLVNHSCSGVIVVAFLQG